MYARRVKSRTLTFAVSGLLWEGSLVMIDNETETLWSHLLGEAVQGPLKGEALEVIPSVMTDWATWRSRYGKSSVVVMPRTSQVYTRDFHGSQSPLVLGYSRNDQTRTWTFDDMARYLAINDDFGGQPLLVTFHRPSRTPMLFTRLVGERELHFQMREDELVDRETGSTWDGLTGRATAGPLQGSRLQSLGGIVSFGHNWEIYHPDQSIWEPPADAERRDGQTR